MSIESLRRDLCIEHYQEKGYNLKKSLEPIYLLFKRKNQKFDGKSLPDEIKREHELNILVEQFKNGTKITLKYYWKKGVQIGGFTENSINTISNHINSLKNKINIDEQNSPPQPEQQSLIQESHPK